MNYNQYYNCLTYWNDLKKIYTINNIDISFLDNIQIIDTKLFEGNSKVLVKTSYENYLCIKNMNINELEFYLFCLISYYTNNNDYIFKIPNIYIKNIELKENMEIYTDKINFNIQIKEFKDHVSAQYLNVANKSCYSNLFDSETKKDILLYLESIVDILYFLNINGIYCNEYEILFDKNLKQIYLIDFGQCFTETMNDVELLDIRAKYYSTCNIFFNKYSSIYKQIMTFRHDYLEKKIDDNQLNILRNKVLNDSKFTKDDTTEYISVEYTDKKFFLDMFGGYFNKYNKYKSKYLNLKNNLKQ